MLFLFFVPRSRGKSWAWSVQAEDIGDATLVALHGREEDGEEQIESSPFPLPLPFSPSKSLWFGLLPTWSTARTYEHLVN